MKNKLRDFLKQNNISNETFKGLASIMLDSLEDNGAIELEKVTDYPVGYFHPEDENNAYFHITSDGDIICTDSNYSDISYGTQTGNCFDTKEQAEKALQQKLAYGELVCLIHKLNRRVGWVAVWKNTIQSKCTFTFSHSDNCIKYAIRQTTQDRPTELYFKKALYGEILDTLGEDTIKLALGVE